MSSKLEKFEQDLLTQITTTFGITKGARLMVGVSGGPDSVALLLGLSNISKSLNIKILAAHVTTESEGQNPIGIKLSWRSCARKSECIAKSCQFLVSSPKAT